MPALFYLLPLTPWQATLSTHASARDSRTLTGKSDSVSCGGQCSFLLGPGMDKILFVPSNLPQSFGSSVIKSQPDSLVGKPIVAPRTFVTVQELLWYNCSPVSGSSAQCEQIWKTQQWPQDWKRSVFIPIPKKGNAKECSKYRTNALISHASKIMLKILQARLQQYVN